MQFTGLRVYHAVYTLWPMTTAQYCLHTVAAVPYPRRIIISSSLSRHDTSVSGQLSLEIPIAAGADITIPVIRCWGFTCRKADTQQGYYKQTH